MMKVMVDTKMRKRMNTETAVAGLELAEMDAEVRAALGWRSQYQSQKREDERERKKIAFDDEQRRLDMELRAEAERLEMRLKESREQHGHELARIQTLSGVGIETLIAVSGPAQSQLLAQWARTRALAGCATEKILAMQVAENPQVAGALKELLIATAASGQLEQYERLVNQLKDSARTSREDYQQNMAVMQQMFDKALDTVKDTAVAFSAAPASTPTPEPGLQAHTGPDGTITVCFS